MSIYFWHSYFVSDIAKAFHEGIPRQTCCDVWGCFRSKHMLCNTMEQDHEWNKSLWLRIVLLEAPSVAEWLILALPVRPLREIFLPLRLHVLPIILCLPVLTVLKRSHVLFSCLKSVYDIFLGIRLSCLSVTLGGATQDMSFLFDFLLCGVLSFAFSAFIDTK